MMKDGLFEDAKREIESMGLLILEAGVIPETSGSWYITIKNDPLLRLMWDRPSGWLVVDEQITGIVDGPRIWKDLWIAENFDLGSVHTGIRIIADKCRR